MAPRPHVLLSVAASLDGHIDDAGTERLLLSDAADLDRVDGVRAQMDAILVGAGTVRADDPRLEVRSPSRRAERVAGSRPATPLKVTVTAGGAPLDPRARFFTGDAGRVVYTTDAAAGAVRARLGTLADVVPAGPGVAPDTILADLAARGVERLMVEGGGRIHTMFLTAGLVDELHLVLAPFFVGDDAAPRFTGAGAFPQDPARPMTLLEARAMGDLVLLRYAPVPGPGIGR
ncbi:hypothetical protein GCM10028784_01920 [Myceligenerans cantabricum]